MSRDRHELPKLADRWSHIYFEHGRLERDTNALHFVDALANVTLVPLDQFALILLGPGTTITQAAVHLLAENNTLLAWCGEEGVRLYAFGTGGTHSSRRLLRQASMWANPVTRLQVIARMYRKRFDTPIPANTTLEQVRGMEGWRVREAYRRASEATGVKWDGRKYDQRSWNKADPINRALSAASACLYGICHTAILTAGYSSAIGFIHTGKQLSFVYDIADLYRTALTIPLAFEIVQQSTDDVERRARMACRSKFHSTKLLKTILDDIAEVLDARDDSGEMPNEFEGTAVSLADGAEIGDLPGESILPNPGGVVEAGS